MELKERYQESDRDYGDLALSCFPKRRTTRSVECEAVEAVLPGRLSRDSPGFITLSTIKGVVLFLSPQYLPCSTRLLAFPRVACRHSLRPALRRSSLSPLRCRIFRVRGLELSIPLPRHPSSGDPNRLFPARLLRRLLWRPPKALPPLPPVTAPST